MRMKQAHVGILGLGLLGGSLALRLGGSGGVRQVSGWDADPAVRAAWRGVAFAGKRPTPRDVVNHCLKRLRDETRLS